MHQFLWKLETVWTLQDNKVSILQDHLEMYFNWKRPPGSSWEKDIFLAQNEMSCCNGTQVQDALIYKNPKIIKL